MYERLIGGLIGKRLRVYMSKYNWLNEIYLSIIIGTVNLFAVFRMMKGVANG